MSNTLPPPDYGRPGHLATQTPDSGQHALQPNAMGERASLVYSSGSGSSDPQQLQHSQRLETYQANLIRLPQPQLSQKQHPQLSSQGNSALKSPIHSQTAGTAIIHQDQTGYFSHYTPNAQGERLDVTANVGTGHSQRYSSNNAFNTPYPPLANYKHSGSQAERSNDTESEAGSATTSTTASISGTSYNNSHGGSVDTNFSFQNFTPVPPYAIYKQTPVAGYAIPPGVATPHPPPSTQSSQMTDTSRGSSVDVGLHNHSQSSSISHYPSGVVQAFSPTNYAQLGQAYPQSGEWYNVTHPQNGQYSDNYQGYTGGINNAYVFGNSVGHENIQTFTPSPALNFANAGYGRRDSASNVNQFGYAVAVPAQHQFYYQQPQVVHHQPFETFENVNSIPRNGPVPVYNSNFQHQPQAHPHAAQVQAQIQAEAQAQASKKNKSSASISPMKRVASESDVSKDSSKKIKSNSGHSPPTAAALTLKNMLDSTAKARYIRLSSAVQSQLKDYELQPQKLHGISTGDNMKIYVRLCTLHTYYEALVKLPYDSVQCKLDFEEAAKLGMIVYSHLAKGMGLEVPSMKKAIKWKAVLTWDIIFQRHGKLVIKEDRREAVESDKKIKKNEQREDKDKDKEKEKEDIKNRAQNVTAEINQEMDKKSDTKVLGYT